LAEFERGLRSDDADSVRWGLTRLTACGIAGQPPLCRALEARVEPWTFRRILIMHLAPRLPSWMPHHPCVVDVLKTAVASDVPAVRVMAAARLLEYDAGSGRPLVAPLAEVVAQRRWLDAAPDMDPQGGTAAALTLLANIGEPAAPAQSSIVAALRSYDPEEKILACRALAAIGPSAVDSLPALREATQDHYYAVQDAAPRRNRGDSPVARSLIQWRPSRRTRGCSRQGLRSPRSPQPLQLILGVGPTTLGLTGWSGGSD
jgi:hypothetical protein